jgi:hypothetical protein
MIFIKKHIGYTNQGREKFSLKFNQDFWKQARDKYTTLNVVIDEAHSILDSRRSMSHKNQIMNDFIALLRRILGDSGDGYGELILITQLNRRLDIIAKELATSVHYHKCHYIKNCLKCGLKIKECNEDKNKFIRCPTCKGHRFKKTNFVIEKFEFENTELLDFWLENKVKTYHKHYYITDIEQYFKYYDTYQWENLISEF